MRCNECSQDKPKTSYYANRRTCKDCYSVKSKKLYAKRRDIRIEAKRSQGTCDTCDETDIRLFEFAHYVGMKTNKQGFGQIMSVQSLQRELKSW